MAQQAIVVQPVLQLTDAPYQLSPGSFRFGHVAMESAKYVSIHQKKPGGHELVVVNMDNNNTVTRLPTKGAEAGVMNPVDNIVALKAKGEGGAGHVVQVFDLDTKTRLAEHAFPEDVIFWRWCGARFLAIVTTSNVYHWEIAATATPPLLAFARAGDLAESSGQVINYATDATTVQDTKWALLTGIALVDRVIQGHMQLYSVERKQQQFLDGHAGCFGELVTDETKPPVQVFCFMERKEGVNKVHVMDIGQRNGAPQLKVSAEVQYPPEAATDFPVHIDLSKRFGVLYAATKGGLLFVIDAMSCQCIYRQKVSQQTIFLATGNSLSGGFLMANKDGQLLSGMVNPQALIPTVATQLRSAIPNAQEIANSLGRRYGYPSFDRQNIETFNALMARKDYKGAARIVALMKSGALRTTQILSQFRNAQGEVGQPSPILVFFTTLLEYGKLLHEETLELVRPVALQGRKEFIQKWISENRLHFSEELGDLVRPLDAALALHIYKQAGASSKVFGALAESGSIQAVIDYARTSTTPVDFGGQLRTMLASTPEKAVELAKGLLLNQPPLIHPQNVLDIFLQQNRVTEATTVMLAGLRGDDPSTAHLQTRVIEINLQQNPQVAEAIFQSGTFSHYDRKHIGQCCERAGLYQRALEHYTDPKDIKRIMVLAGGKIDQQWITNYLGRLTPEASLEILSDMLKSNRSNMQVVVQACIKYHEKIGVESLIAMLESQNLTEGIFYLCGAILSTTTNPEVHFHYIQSAAKLNNLLEVERVCRESHHYEPKRVKDFLKEAKLGDPRPLIYVCDLHGFADELTDYLWKSNLKKFIEVYVCKVNPQNTPVVVGVLVDLEAPDDFIMNLLQNVRAACPVGLLVQEVERRNRLQLILPWLEARLSEGNQDTELHNALAKIYIDTNNDPEEFLNNNNYYDPAVIGRYCADRDPHLAFAAYSKANGTADRELVALANQNGLFRLQAKYLVKRQDPELWRHVLQDPATAEYRQQVIEQVVSSALPESTVAEEVSCVVKAFMVADMPQALIELLERIVLHAGQDTNGFGSNTNLQNLLILTAVRASPDRVKDYINRLNKFDSREVALVCLDPKYALYEEALQVYRKTEQHLDALNVLLENIQSLDRAAEYAARVDDPSCWSRLASAQIQFGDVDANREAIDSFIKANDASAYREVTETAQRAGIWDDLVRYLIMARGKEKNTFIDSELAYALACDGRLAELEDFFTGATLASKEQIGDRLFKDAEQQCKADVSLSLFNAARICFSSAGNNSRVAQTQLRLKNYEEATAAARRANNPKIWKEVTLDCIAAGEFAYAHQAALHMVVYADHLEDVVSAYENANRTEDLFVLLEEAVGSTRAHATLYTELGVAYAKYRPEKLGPYLRSTNVQDARLNIPKLVRTCEKNHLWNEAVHLYAAYGEFDMAAQTMIKHPSERWDHEGFCSILRKVSNTEFIYSAVAFYVASHPEQLVALLKVIGSKIDHGRLIEQVRKEDLLPLIQEYLEFAQGQEDLAAVNAALHELYLDQEDWPALRASVTKYSSFDQLALASQLEQHPLLEMRKIAGVLYRRKKRFAKSLEVHKKDEAHADAMETAKESTDPKIVEDLLRYFVFEKKDKEAFAACLHVCYEFVSPDLVLELAWFSNFTEFAMPFLVQSVRDMNLRILHLERKQKEMEKSVSAADYAGPSTAATVGWSVGSFTSNLALTAGNSPPPSVPAQHGLNSYNSVSNAFGNSSGQPGSMRF